MQSVTSATAVATTARANDITLFASLELSKSKWVVTINSPGSEKFSRHGVEGGDGAGLLDLLSRSRAKAEQRYGVRIETVVIQEAGLDGFSIHRLLLANGIESHVVDAASIAVARRHRRAKTEFDRRRDAVADADGLGSRRAAGLFHGSGAEPGRRGSPAPDARARHAAQGTHSAYQSGQGPAQRPGRPGLQSASARPCRTTGGAANRRRSRAAADAEGGNPPGARSDRGGDDATGCGRTRPRRAGPHGSRGAEQPRRPAPQAQGLGP